MGRAVSVPHRQIIFERDRKGHAAAQIADDLGLNRETVRKLIARFRKLGIDGLKIAYDRCGQQSPLKADAKLIEAAVALRREHPGWGAEMIRVILKERGPQGSIPCARTLQRYFRRVGLQPDSTGRRRVAEDHRRAKEAHQVWQVDACEQMTWASGEKACWLRIVDEASGAVLRTEIFPLGVWNGVPPESTREVFRDAFARWGLPRRSALTTARLGVPKGICRPS